MDKSNDDWYDFSSNPYMSDAAKISFLQRRVLVASICYYQFNGSPISDYTYARISYQLLRLMKKADKKEVERSDYWYVFKDYDGSTGFDLSYKLTDKDKEYLLRIANNVYRR